MTCVKGAAGASSTIGRVQAHIVVFREANALMLEDGVKPGERVVVYPSDALKDGARLEVRSR